MNENVDYFKDQKEQLNNAVDKAILQAQLIQDVLPSKALDKLLTHLGVIRALYPPFFKQFIISQCVEDGKLPEQEFELWLGHDTFFKITVELKKVEKENTSEKTTTKKKWYQF